MPLGTEVELRTSHIVLDGDPAPPCERGTAAPSFRPMSIVATVAHFSCCLAFVNESMGMYVSVCLSVECLEIIIHCIL